VALVEDVYVEHHIVPQFFRRDQTAQGQLVTTDVVYTQFSQRIPDDKETALRYRAGSGVNLLGTTSKIIDMYLLSNFSLPLLQPHLPQPEVPIEAAR
jgi:hypothetical protein